MKDKSDDPVLSVVEDRVHVTVSLPKSVKVGLKVYAASNGTNVSALVEKWYYENCKQADVSHE